MASQNFGCHNEKALSDVNTHHVMLHEHKQLTASQEQFAHSQTVHMIIIVSLVLLSLLLAWRGNEKVIKKGNKTLGLILIHVNFVS